MYSTMPSSFCLWFTVHSNIIRCPTSFMYIVWLNLLYIILQPLYYNHYQCYTISNMISVSIAQESIVTHVHRHPQLK